MDKYYQSAVKLHNYLFETHWDGKSLVGPDPGVRLNYRIGRFIKSYFPAMPWNDNLYYLQGQGYWVLGNWTLFEQTGEAGYRDIALCSSKYILEQQRDDGAWDYPNPEWKQRVATIEGIWGSLGLLESYRQTNSAPFLTGALRWYKFMIEEIGFQEDGHELAINYFANRLGDRVPNNSICLLRFLAELSDVTGDKIYLQFRNGLFRFIQSAQKTTGEMPYTVIGTSGGNGRSHFQCYQYNAFQCLDLIRYYELTGDATVLPIITKILQFLQGGVSEDGHALYECGNKYRAVAYHAGVLGMAFSKAGQVGFDTYEDLAHMVYAYLLEQQQPDGSFTYSHGDYYLFADRRSYPRYLAMIMCQLLYSESGNRNKKNGFRNHHPIYEGLVGQ